MLNVRNITLIVSHAAARWGSEEVGVVFSPADAGGDTEGVKTYINNV